MSQHTEPCPNCQTHHAAGVHNERLLEDGRLVILPPDVRCSCGAVLRYTVPIFRTTAEGWLWRIIVPAGSIEARGARFHAHLDDCQQCRVHPFRLCSTGESLLREILP